MVTSGFIFVLVFSFTTLRFSGVGQRSESTEEEPLKSLGAHRYYVLKHVRLKIQTVKQSHCLRA